MSLETDIPFNAEELKDFVEVTPPEVETPPADTPPSVSPEDITSLRRDFQRDVENIKYQLSQRNTPTPAVEQKTPARELPEEIPIRYSKDGKGNVVVALDDLQPTIDRLAQQRLDAYHKENIEPYANTVQATRREQALQESTAYLEKTAPEILIGRDKRVVAQTALDLFNSDFNTGTDDTSRVQYVSTKLREMFPVLEEGAQTGSAQTTPQSLPLSTGNTMRNATAANQLGATPPRPQQGPAGLPAPGTTFKIKQMSINEAGGLEEYQAYVGRINELYALNEQYGMGWKFVPAEGA
ncbi:MAG: hypothetical protein E6Q97_16160 [Desulfurellales bacterium]|nr:MAG: hypothetical protein E6Q97_16160 [Desulfurellales bacterium]